MGKANFIRQLQIDASGLAQMMAQIRDRKGVYVDRGYQSGGTDAITDADVVEATGNENLTAADFAPMGTGLAALFLQLIALLDGQAVTQGDYGETLNRVRGDV